MIKWAENEAEFITLRVGLRKLFLTPFLPLSFFSSLFVAVVLNDFTNVCVNMLATLLPLSIFNPLLLAPAETVILQSEVIFQC